MRNAMQWALFLLWLVTVGLSMMPVLIGLMVLTVLFPVIHQPLAAWVMFSLLLIGALCRLTNGFGVKFN